jgi:hypothetical protein
MNQDCDDGTCRLQPHSPCSGNVRHQRGRSPAIPAILHQRGEFSAAVELRQLFPGIDNVQAREWCGNNRRVEAAAQARAPGETARG